MTMPKKGTRRIEVGGQTYRYRVNQYDDWDLGIVFCKVIVEGPDLKRFEEEVAGEFVTPAMVKEIIEQRGMAQAG